jgi:hypothetical protein
MDEAPPRLIPPHLEEGKREASHLFYNQFPLPYQGRGT